MSGSSVEEAAGVPDALPTDQRVGTGEWDLADLYADGAAWEAAVTELESRLPSLGEYGGSLAEGPVRLRRCLDAYFDALKELRRIRTWANLRFDEDTRLARSAELHQRAGLLATRFEEETSFLRPEIVGLGRETVERWLVEEPGLGTYRHFLDDLLRLAPHILSREEERIVAAAGLLTDAPYSTYSMLANADLPWPTVTLVDGTEVRLDPPGYAKYRAAAEREDRRRVFDAFWAVWREYARTFGTLLFGALKRDLFHARARRYRGALSAALDPDHIPERVYRTLIEEANAGLPVLHRYFTLRARMLGLERLEYHDIYPPLVEADLGFPIGEAKRLLIEAVRPLGEEYAGLLRAGLGGAWMDAFPRPGKRAGAYMAGSAYDVHPYVLLNYVDDYDSVSTLAHEWGHAMHAWLSNRGQPFVDADYPIFLAEVASTFNEALLLDRVLAEARGEAERLYYLGHALEQLRGTFFRQAMFAEFELEIHEEVERGGAPSGERFSQLYGEILRRYHGHDEGVVRIDEAFAVEWAYIPHFYYNFYVYQYATCLAASSLLAEGVRTSEPGVAEAYLGLLRAGGSEYAYPALLAAGVDLAAPEPYRVLLGRMTRIMDEIEEILSGPAAGGPREVPAGDAVEPVALDRRCP